MQMDTDENSVYHCEMQVTISAPHMHCFGLEILKDQLKPGIDWLELTE